MHRVSCEICNHASLQQWHERLFTLAICGQLHEGKPSQPKLVMTTPET